MDAIIKRIGESLSGFQSALKTEGSSLEEFIRENYTKKWLSDELYCCMAIRTTFVHAATQFLVNEGIKK